MIKLLISVILAVITMTLILRSPDKVPTAKMSNDPRVATAWEKVKKVYPKQSAHVAAVMVGDINGVYCNCMGAVFGSDPDVIWLDQVQLRVMNELTLEMTLVHEMTHVIQHKDSDMAGLEGRQREAFMAESHYDLWVKYHKLLAMYEKLQ